MVLAASACEVAQPPSQNDPVKTNNNRLVEKSNTNATVNPADECTRSVPEPILRKDFFAETNFELRKYEEYPFQMLGSEKAKLKNGDRLLVEHIGCENYTLVFRFVTERFKRDLNDAEYWYRAAQTLIDQTRQGILDETNLVANGTKALKTYTRKTKQIRYEDEISFGGSVIRSVVTVKQPKLIDNGSVEIEIWFGIGPL